ncbi:MAG: citrate/2-methylcitrate synthase [bacterium]
MECMDNQGNVNMVSIEKPKGEQPKVEDNYRPGLEGVICNKSSVSHVDGLQGILEYRGINIRELAEESCFEETAYLLLYSHLPSEREFNQFKTLLTKSRYISNTIREAITHFPVGMHPMIALQTATALLQGEDYYADDVCSSRHNLRRAISLIARMPTILAAFERHRNGEEPIPPQSKYNHAENLLYMLTGNPPNPEAARVLDKALILHMEHTMNASTFTARVIGSTQASIYSAISGAVGALSGSLHGGANERVIRMLYSIGHPDNVESFVDEKLNAKAKIMGIGHRVYKTKDPRADVLQSLIPELLDAFPGEEVKTLYKIALKLEEIVDKKLSHKNLCPNVDFYSGIVYECLGIPIDLFTCLFAISRVVGWAAHWLEQVQDNRIFRPTQQYIGDHNRPYIPIKER